MYVYLYHRNHGPVVRSYTFLFPPKIKKHRIGMILNYLENFQPFQRTQSRKLKVNAFFSPIKNKKLIKEIIVTSCLEEIHLFSFWPHSGVCLCSYQPCYHYLQSSLRLTVLIDLTQNYVKFSNNLLVISEIIQLL